MVDERLTVEEPAKDDSAALEGTKVAREDDAALDEIPLGVVDAEALEDERVTAPEEDATLDGASLDVNDAAVLEDRRGELAGEDNCPEPVLEDGTTTIPVGVADDNTGADSEVSKENVGKGLEDGGAELGMLVEEAAGAEREALLDSTLPDEDTTGPRLEA